MQKVKNYMNAYKNYAKTEREKLEAMKKDSMYSQEYLTDQEKKLNQALDAKRQEYLKGINEIIDGKLSDIKRPDTNTAEYQAAVANIFTKVQLLGNHLNGNLLKEILAPAVEKQDNSTIEAVRSYVQGLQAFPGGESRKREVLESAPRVINQAELLENARIEINRAFNNSNFGTSNLNSGVAIHYMEQSGVFEL